MILSVFKWGFISFVFWFVFSDILLMDWVSPMSSGSQADKNVKTGFLGFSNTNTHTMPVCFISWNEAAKRQMSDWNRYPSKVLYGFILWVTVVKQIYTTVIISYVIYILILDKNIIYMCCTLICICCHWLKKYTRKDNFNLMLNILSFPFE